MKRNTIFYRYIYTLAKIGELRKLGKASCFEEGSVEGREEEEKEEEKEEEEEKGSLFVRMGWQFASRVPRSAYDTMRNQ